MILTLLCPENVSSIIKRILTSNFDSVSKNVRKFHSLWWKIKPREQKVLLITASLAAPLTKQFSLSKLLKQQKQQKKKMRKRWKLCVGKLQKIGTEKASQVHKHRNRKFSHVDFSFIKAVVTIKCENGFRVEKNNFLIFLRLPKKNWKRKFPN